MNTARAETVCLLIAGGLLLAIGIGHLLMPTMGYDPATSMQMPMPIRNHFYYLGTYAICGFLLSLGCLSLVFAFVPNSWATRVFSGTMAALWAVRLWLEFLYPVDLPIFLLANPHPWLVAVLGLVTAAFSVATLLNRAPLTSRA